MNHSAACDLRIRLTVVAFQFPLCKYSLENRKELDTAKRKSVYFILRNCVCIGLWLKWCQVCKYLWLSKFISSEQQSEAQRFGSRKRKVNGGERNCIGCVVKQTDDRDQSQKVYQPVCKSSHLSVHWFVSVSLFENNFVCVKVIMINC